MGTRTNFYKNPSYAYNKQFNLNSVLQNLNTYNIAVGHAAPVESAPVVQRKRRHQLRPPAPVDQLNQEKTDYGPMTHREYIDRRRKEADSTQPYQELTANVLGSSSSALNLVGYKSDSCTSAECEEDQGSLKNFDERLDSIDAVNYFKISGSIEGAGQIKTRSEQRYPAQGEPVCVVCQKYGEFICNETDDDICSMECKAELLQSIKTQMEPQSSQPYVQPLSARRCTLEVPEFGGDTWDFDRNRWSKKRSGLCTYECWKCHMPGHLAEDCLVLTSCESSSSAAVCNRVAIVQNTSSVTPRDLLDLYKRCQRIGKNFLSAKCNSCRGSTSLATCLSCDNSFCDCAGHLSRHISEHPTHQQYYSFKLKRLVKCCKSNCKVTDIKDLLTCHYCFNKAFDKFYDMYTASWKPSGLSIIWNSICCEDHFEWHRMNCLNADVEGSAYILHKRETQKYVQLSDFIF